LKPDRLNLPITVLSGGERRRVELTRILFAGSDMLLLDEPTNHLDVDAKTWLLGFMRDYRGALLVISHDLDLLDEAITRVLHLDRPQEDSVGELIEYRGTYSQYKTSRAGDEARLAKKAATQQ
jgi:ATPase subunit of ABC transporter with duplicated ATPase domains